MFQESPEETKNSDLIFFYCLSSMFISCMDKGQFLKLKRFKLEFDSALKFKTTAKTNHMYNPTGSIFFKKQSTESWF